MIALVSGHRDGDDDNDGDDGDGEGGDDVVLPHSWTDG